MDFDCNVPPQYIPNKLCIKLPYHNLRKGDAIWLSCFILDLRSASTDRLVDESSFSQYI